MQWLDLIQSVRIVVTVLLTLWQMRIYIKTALLHESILRRNASDHEFFIHQPDSCRAYPAASWYSKVAQRMSVLATWAAKLRAWS